MRKKSAIMALAAVFLFQTQVLAAIENESEILSKTSTRSAPTKQGGKKADSGNISWDNEPEVVSESERQKEILSGKAKRSVSVDMGKDKDKSEKPSKNRRVVNGVIIEDKKDVAAERAKIEEKKKNKESRARVLEESRIVSDADWQREILSGNAKRSVGLKREDSEKVENKEKKNNSQLIRNGIIVEPKKVQDTVTDEKASAEQKGSSNAWPHRDWQRDALAVNAKTGPVQRNENVDNIDNKGHDPNQVVRNGVVMEKKVADPVAKEVPKAPVLPREHLMMVPPSTISEAQSDNTKRVERNGVVFILKDETPVVVKEEKPVVAEEKKDTKDAKSTKDTKSTKEAKTSA